MKLTSVRIERALTQMDGRVIPESNPIVQELISIFGDHTFFVSNAGLSTVEPVEANDAELDKVRIVRLARWADESKASLVPHPPINTETMVTLSAAA
ncbi:hypothetical protein J8I29_05515 [Labrys sp. LIt4]|uniref:Uncharacterized protein n=1 Tax=Labrys okinawensis TaxID=346911 RepID=A0A2S9QAX0_9HYPH|nr:MULTISPECIES: hypothetical protein [Labrys]MBP0578758.1 hypothetical protein [Labrys sp. LIt4]PRH86489.1 hypothetical protein C5L14_14195 [Labrys okinawensis]